MSPDAYTEMDRLEQNHWWFRGRRSILDKVISSLGLAGKAKVLEIGSGTGGNFSLLKEYGELSALEMNATAIDISKRNHKDTVEVRQGHCPDDVPFEENSFDLICMFDVLEHIREDAETIELVNRLLKTGGHLVVTVPAYSWMFGPHDEFLHHKRRYSVAKLKTLLKGTELEASYLTYFNSILFPAVAIVRLKEALIKGGRYGANNVPPNLLNRFLEKIFSFERHFIGRFYIPFGVSILSVSKKSSGSK